jgi:hypothetical protein
LGGRYYITGVQIGMLRAFAKLENETDINKVLDDVEEQYLGEKEEFAKMMTKLPKKKKTKLKK